MAKATIESTARVLALQNAVKYKGKANPKALLGGLLGAHPALKADLQRAHTILDKTVKEVNALSLASQEAELRAERPDFDKKERREGLKPLPNAEQKRVVLRFEPSPSGPMHIGHAYTFGLNVEYARMYDGLCYLRIADTNPENISVDAYDLLPKDAEWLSGGAIADTWVQSDRMPIYYQHALQLLQEGFAYVCDCEAGDFKKLRDQGVACECRGVKAEEHVLRWKRMHDASAKGYARGGAVVRFKSDIGDKNPAMRDFPLLRINEEEHPRQGKKYRVWPLMNFSVAVDDKESGVTHTLRGKDHADNAKKQALIHEAFGCKTPTAISVGRINFKGFPVSCSATRPRIEAGEFSGWDDIRLPFLPALRRRGITAAALRKYAVEVGVTKNDKSVSIEEFFTHVYALNKEVVDATAKRYFFVADPVKVMVGKAPTQKLELDKHPDNDKGGRHFNTKESFYLSKKDVETIAKKKWAKVRFMDCMTVTVEGNGTFSFDKQAYVKGETDAIIHWLPADEDAVDLVDVELVMPDASVVNGLAEKGVASVQEGDVVQFERVGFARYDGERDGKRVFWYAHR